MAQAWADGWKIRGDITHDSSDFLSALLTPPLRLRFNSFHSLPF